MGKLNPDVVAQWIEQDCAQTAFQPVRDVLANTLRNRIAAYSDEQIAELAEELAPAVSASLEKRVADYSEEGIEAPFAVSVEEGASYFKAHHKIENTLLREMRRVSPAAFEVFCKMILLKLNADAVVVGGPHDGGVDFYAIGLSWGKLVDPAPPSSKAIVVGQSKRYGPTNDVGEGEIRAFVGGTIKRLDDLRRNNPKRFGLLTPVLLAFWTTGDFSLSAKRHAQELGLWYLNGIGLAQLATRLGLSIHDLEASESEAEKLQLQRRGLLATTPPRDRLLGNYHPTFDVMNGPGVAGQNDLS